MSLEDSNTKKGWLQKLANRFQHPQQKETIEYTLADEGIKVAKDTRLDSRLAALYDLHNLISSKIESTTPKEYLSELKTRLDYVNLAIINIASPYARAGDYPQYRRMLRGWASWYAIASSWIQRTEDYFLTEENNPIDAGIVDTGIFVRMQHDVIQKHVFKDAFTVLNCCFRDKDVSVHAVTVIQSMQMPMMGGGGETITGSGGRTSEDQRVRRPQGGPYRKEIENQV